MWDFFQTVRHRHSVRRYQSDVAIEPEALHGVLEMALAGPSAGDLQAYHLVVVRDGDLRGRLAEHSGEGFLAEAPVNIVVCADPEHSAARFGERGRALFALQDATIAATYIQLAAVAEGLGSAWAGGFEEDALRELLQLEDHLRPVAVLALGYPAEIPEPTPRRKLNELVTYR
ncbi:nitroreductase [Thiohalorhabdus denitrificans]|uniref:Nitroreductase n=1 Tax=Thiohalorhabdus denitrificans TaxID=381306 RepID=A0A0P9GGM3_9GAMM|nr:nitroreductase family protein [Thiohalorhabdus denitrificans]KPV39171.1 nitroreductase [Thiohalorhabdus denitrificans]SCX75843.1 Nitroreductase [Thiohalorhabdus denitrificans]